MKGMIGTKRQQLPHEGHEGFLKVHEGCNDKAVA
jgi:hypothetical protein